MFRQIYKYLIVKKQIEFSKRIEDRLALCIESHKPLLNLFCLFNINYINILCDYYLYNIKIDHDLWVYGSTKSIDIKYQIDKYLYITTRYRNGNIGHDIIFRNDIIHMIYDEVILYINDKDINNCVINYIDKKINEYKEEIQKFEKYKSKL